MSRSPDGRFVLLLLLFACVIVGLGTGRAEAQAQAIRVLPFRDRGAQVSWSPTGNNRIAYATKGADGFYDVHLADPDGGRDICLTCQTPGLPTKHVGGPFWHPRGTYLVLVVEKAEHPGTSYEAIPGFGSYSDIWCVTPDGQHAYPLTDIPADPDHGLLIPRFSPDGKRLAWTERVERPNFFSPTQAAGFWSLKVADFVETPNGPTLKNTRTFTPGGRSFYEGYGFTPDGKRILFCSSMNQPSFFDQDIYSIDASTGGDLHKLTNGDYNEHAFCTPDGTTILWMSNKGNPHGGTDWWMMDASGANQRRLTYFNEPGNPQYMGQTVYAGLGSFAPDGTRFVGDIQLNLITQEATIKIIELAPQPAVRALRSRTPRRPTSLPPRR